jgi:hypothetical protein
VTSLWAIDRSRTVCHAGNASGELGVRARLHVSELMQVVAVAARLSAFGGECAERVRSDIIELLLDSCDMTTLTLARVRVLQRLGEPEALRADELRLLDEVIMRASQEVTTLPDATSAA